MDINSYKVNVVSLPHCVSLPKYAHDDGGDAAADAYAAVDEPVTILPGETCLIPLGFKVEVPDGFMLAVLARSGLAVKGVQCANAPGVVDSNYRGEVKAILYNSSNDKPFVINRGDRVCQVALVPVFRMNWNVVDELSETARGANGFGSTGINKAEEKKTCASG